MKFEKVSLQEPGIMLMYPSPIKTYYKVSNNGKVLAVQAMKAYRGEEVSSTNS